MIKGLVEGGLVQSGWVWLHDHERVIEKSTRGRGGVACGLSGSLPSEVSGYPFEIKCRKGGKKRKLEQVIFSKLNFSKNVGVVCRRIEFTRALSLV
jgi:hypothetical protein